jgi:phosphate transport system substrate-binding protein
MWLASLALVALTVHAPPQLAELARSWNQQFQATPHSKVGTVQLTMTPPAGCVPVAVSGTAVVYNILVAGDLKLSREGLKAILEGRITRWDDPAIASANPGVTLPKAAIALVLPPDESLHAVKQLLGSFTPAAGAKRLANEDAVALFVSQTDNAFSIVDGAHARRQSLYVAALPNKAGEWVTPNPRSVARAAVGVVLPQDLRTSIVDAQGREAYPLATLVYGCGDNKEFLDWALHDGRNSLVPLGFSALPGLVVLLASQLLGR